MPPDPLEVSCLRHSILTPLAFGNYSQIDPPLLCGVNLKFCFFLLNASSRSARCRHVSVSIFPPLVCSTPRVALFVVDLSPFQSLLLLVCSTASTLRVALLVVDVVSTVDCSDLGSDVSGSFLNTLTFVELVLLSFSLLCRSLLIFHSPELLQYFDLYLIAFKSDSVLLLSVLLLLLSSVFSLWAGCTKPG